MTDNTTPPESDPKQSSPEGKKPGASVWYLLAVLGLVVALSIALGPNARGNKIGYSDFVAGLKSGKYTPENVHNLRFGSSTIVFQNKPLDKSSLISSEPDPESEKFADVKLERFYVDLIGLGDEARSELRLQLIEADIDVSGTSPPFDWGAFSTLLSIVVLLALMYFILKRVGGPGSALSFGRSRGRMIAEDDVTATFESVAGQDEAVEELREIVEFLRTPGKYQALGGRIPRGVLLVGPPGTGKTLLAKAVAGEAGVPFFSLSGSDFVEMFVGVGAARVRDMFQQAIQRSPAIIFIDELDALGKARGSGMPGGHDEREQTLNALLVEMDGFSSDESVIVMGATNRPETLDPALLRPGRFDRNVLVDRPDVKGREAILNVHIQKIKKNDTVDIESIAKQTPGFVGADLANLVNEAALLAARANKDTVGMSEFEEGVERVVAGLEKSSRIIHEDEKLRVAYHECGHALVACSLPHTDPVVKISIIPRGIGALGYMRQSPTDDRYLASETELRHRIAVMYGGIAAEEIVFNETSTGPANDLERASDMARRMVCEFGMSPRMGRVAYEPSGRNPFLDGPKSGSTGAIHAEQTLREIDEEIKRILDECMQIARDVLRERRDVLERITKELLELEVMDSDQLQKILDEFKTGPQLTPGTSAVQPSDATPSEAPAEAEADASSEDAGSAS